MNTEQESIRCMASCPVCGRGLCKAVPHSVVEIYCPKCKNPLLVCFENNSVAIKVLNHSGTAGTGGTGQGTIC